MGKFEDAFKQVCELAEDFRRNENQYLSPSYQEAEVRRDYIDKFFEALGWDIYHKEQKNPYEQEVKVERGVSITSGKAQKRADYAFYISPEFRSPKFFVEAKKPSRNLKNPDDYFQTIRYGWNANTPVAVLTDFQEFHILDCRFKPDVEYVLLNQNHKIFGYNQYTDLEKFKEIYYLFSRSEVENGSLEKYSESLPKPKGKSAQKGIFPATAKPIDEDFLEYIDDVRETLAKAFKRNDASLTSEQLTEVTQKTVDRLVFIRFLEDKLIEPEYYISELGRKSNPWKEFISLCRKLDAKYNGIVFKETVIDKQTFKGPDETEFLSICNGISRINSPYDFHYIPIHILGSIYERFLGKIVTLKGRGIKIEEKPEVRKAGGVYYTPKYIVDYIVKNTVGKLIENKTPEEISKLRFADIACGSGSFLIGVYENLLEYHKAYYQSRRKQAEKDGCIDVNGVMVLSLKQKQEILLNNIYGVDIDHQAVEVTQLSLTLKMLEDETTYTTRQMQMDFQKKIIPGQLSKNIVCGNSLIGTDILSGNMFAGDEERKLNPLDFETAFPEVMRSGGFDAIVGNPPWGASFNDNELEYLRINNLDIVVRMIDSFMFFVYKSAKLMKSDGYFGMILPDVILYQKDNKKLREFIIGNLRIKKIINFGNGVFKNVNRPSCIIILEKAICNDNEITVFDLTKNKYKDSILSEAGEKIQQNKYLIFNELHFYTSQISQYDLLEKIFSLPHKTLDEYIDEDGIQRGVSPDLKEAFIVDEEIILKWNLEKEFLRQTITGGKQIKRYYIFDSTKSIIYTNRETNFKNIPNICNYINQFRSQISCIEVKQKKHSLYSLHRARDEKIFKKQEKIVGVITEDEIITSIDNKMYYPTDGVYLFAAKNLNSKLLLSILNSKLFVFLYRLISLETGRALAQVKPTTIAKLPIINFDSQKNEIGLKLVSFVDQMLDAKKKLHEFKTEKDKTYYERKCESLDRQIDSEVYKLYGLTDEEIKIVEGKN